MAPGEHYQQDRQDPAQEGRNYDAMSVTTCDRASDCPLTDVTVILQAGFDILLGRIEVHVPWVEPGDDYSLVREYALSEVAEQALKCSLTSIVFGDSGDFSAQFTILE